MTLAWITAEDRDRYADALRLAGVAGGVLQRLGGDPRLEATLEDHVGVLHLDRNELVDARRHLERGLALREKLLGPASDDYARSLQHLAILEEAAGDFARSFELHHRARTTAEAELGPRHPDVLAMLSAEGSALYRLARYPEAAELLGRGLATAEQVAGPSSDLAASFLTNLGLADKELKHYAEARTVLERSYAIHAQHGSDSLGAGTLDLDLAQLFLATGEVGLARPRAEHAVAIFGKVEGPTNPDVATALEALATAELRSNRPERAVAALERAVAIRAAIAGTPPNDLAATRFDLAHAILAAHGSLARARQLAEDARHALEGIGDADGVREVSAWLQAHR